MTLVMYLENTAAFLEYEKTDSYITQYMVALIYIIHAEYFNSTLHIWPRENL